MKDILKKAAGFTLVELIAVIAILGILAGVAVPAYSGYMTKAKDAAALVKLEAISAAAQAADPDGIITSIVVKKELVRFEYSREWQLSDETNETKKRLEADFADLYGAVLAGTIGYNGAVVIAPLGLEGTSYEGGATWNGTEWTPGA